MSKESRGEGIAKTPEEKAKTLENARRMLAKGEVTQAQFDTIEANLKEEEPKRSHHKAHA